MFCFSSYLSNAVDEFSKYSASRKVVRSPDKGREILASYFARKSSRTASPASAPTASSDIRRIGFIDLMPAGNSLIMLEDFMNYLNHIGLHSSIRAHVDV